MSSLDRKLRRDLWRIKGQAIAIGAVIGVGVLLLVMMSGLVTSLDETRNTYYERYRLADIFAPVTRAPDRLIAELAAIPGVSAAEGRVTGIALIDIPNLELPIQARAVSLPDFGEPRLNDVYLSAGRRLNSAHPNEILLLQGFAQAHGLLPGDVLFATMQGAKRSLRIVGLVQSPEFLYTTPPGEIAPDDSRFGVIWMSRTALSAAYDMEGAFNQALLAINRNAEQEAVLDTVNRLLKTSGGLGAYGVEDHESNRYISEEIDGLRLMSRGVPPIFLMVAAFLLHIVVSRMVQSERTQIGLLKAFGYRNIEVVAHYFKLILVIATGGALAGCLVGIAAGRGLMEVYLEYFRFPFLVFQLDPQSFVIGLGVSVLAASTGGLIVLRSVFALTPAAAMRPPAPQDYSRVGSIGRSPKKPHNLDKLLDQPSRMVLRRLTRQPMRMAGAVIGISAGMALSVAMTSLLSSFNRTIDLTFDVLDRSHMTLTFVKAISDKAMLELQRIPGVLEVEPVRRVPAILRNGHKTYNSAVNGLVAQPRLNRTLDKNMSSISINPEGIILASALAKILDIAPGDNLTVEVREGRRPVFDIPVIGIAETLLGAPAFMELETLNRALREPGRVSGAYLRIDALESDQIYRQLKNIPTVAGVSLKTDARIALQKLMDTSAGAVRYIMAAIAAVITFGVIYNTARIAYAERARDLASLRVMGFTKGETAFVLLGELAAITLLALPIGSILGYFLSFSIAASFSSDLYQINAVFTPESYGAALVAVVVAALVSGWLVKEDVDRTDLIIALKTGE
jgi:putative ABC transport system permease protein